MKRIKETPATRRARLEWASQWPRCWACNGNDWPGVQTHHIIGAAARSNELANYSRLCGFCHGAAHGERIVGRGGKVRGRLTLSNVLWLKRYHDAASYDAARLTQLKGETLPTPTPPSDWRGGEAK